MYPSISAFKPKQNSSIAGSTVPNGTYVEVLSAANNTKGSAGLFVHNTSGATVVLAIGGAGSEVDIPFSFASGVLPHFIAVDIPKGVRISAKGIGSAGSTGSLVVNRVG